MIWHVAVHPDHRRRGLGAALLDRAEELARERNLVRLEAWTRDDPWVLAWYRSRAFELVDSYLHVYFHRDGDGAVQSTVEGLRPARTFAHYVGSDREAMRGRFERVHDCNLLERRL
jgi:ribosomal protein S18 acetylase RimI-like enzyme